MAVRLVEVTRGKVCERISRGDVAVVNGQGRGSSASARTHTTYCRYLSL